jgi:hypothetical protein
MNSLRFAGTTMVPARGKLPELSPNEQMRQVGRLRILERIVANDCFLPRRGSWECANCAYAHACV